jgi:hypothetical protein
MMKGYFQMLLDLPEPELRLYEGSQVTPPDFTKFWDSTLKEVNADPIEVEIESVSSPLSAIKVFDVSFSGMDELESGLGFGCQPELLVVCPPWSSLWDMEAVEVMQKKAFC